MHIFDLITILIFVSGLFIFLNTFFLKLPPSLGLMILTMFLSLVMVMTGKLLPSFNFVSHLRAFDFSEVLNQLVISVILFAGGLNMNFAKLGKHKMLIIFLSLMSASLSTLVIGTLLYFVLGWLGIEVTYLYSLIFGAVISSTDPISSTKTTQRFSLPKILEIKMEGESLFNGAFSVVLAFLLYHIEIVMEGHPISMKEFSQIVAMEIAGGIGIGVILGYLGFLILKFVDNDEIHIEVLVTMAMVMVGSFITEYLDIYSKLVALVMGLLVGNLGKRSNYTYTAQDDSVGAYVYKFWNLLEQIMSVMLFVLMGLEMLIIQWRLDYFAAGFFAVNIVFFGRWLSIYLPVKMMSSSFHFDKNTISVLTWGAFRGGLPIALILALGQFPGKDLLITMTYVVVVCSILLQGFTLPRMIRERFGNKAILAP